MIEFRDVSLRIGRKKILQNMHFHMHMVIEKNYQEQKLEK